VEDSIRQSKLLISKMTATANSQKEQAEEVRFFPLQFI
jgi:hypothetical protein